MHTKVLLVPMFALMCAATLHAQKEATGPYHDPQYKFAAQPPPGSKVYYTAVAGSNVGFEAHTGLETYWIHAEPAPTDEIQDFVTKQERVVRQLCTSEPSFQENPTTVSGAQAVDIRAVCGSNDPETLGEKRAIRIVVVMRHLDDQGTVVYTLGQLTTPKHEAKTSPVFDAMVNSFKLLDR